MVQYLWNKWVTIVELEWTQDVFSFSSIRIISTFKNDSPPYFQINYDVNQLKFFACYLFQHYVCKGYQYCHSPRLRLVFHIWSRWQLREKLLHAWLCIWVGHWIICSWDGQDFLKSSHLHSAMTMFSFLWCLPQMKVSISQLESTSDHHTIWTLDGWIASVIP